MSQPKLDLSTLFGAALQTMTSNRRQVNALDDNGNHGDNMVENLRMIVEALEAKEKQSPSAALRYASKQLKSKGHGGTSQYYAKGLVQAANQFKGRSSLSNEDAVSLVQSLLGAIPSQGHPKKVKASDTVLEQMMGLAQQPTPGEGLDVGDVLNVLLPAGLAFLQAKQAGADTTTAATQALVSALLAGQVNPLQVGTPRAAAGGLIAQGILQALAGR
jgi:hypothetical protein